MRLFTLRFKINIRGANNSYSDYINEVANIFKLYKADHCNINGNRIDFKNSFWKHPRYFFIRPDSGYVKIKESSIDKIQIIYQFRFERFAYSSLLLLLILSGVSVYTKDFSALLISTIVLTIIFAYFITGQYSLFWEIINEIKGKIKKLKNAL